MYLDSGVTQHMSDERSYFQEMDVVEPKSRPINGIGGVTLYAHGIGNIAFT